MTTIAYDLVPSPVGELLLTADELGLTRIAFEDRGGGHRTDADWVPASSVAAGAAAVRTLADARTQLREYFTGGRTEFSVALAPRGTPFQQRVWTALRAIPFGDTVSYAELARRIGTPRAVRAVGGANGRNPLAVIVPCHRVIGADGSLTGFGGGVDRKRWLLAHEGALGPPGLLSLDL